MLRFFITGGAGFIGSCFVHQAITRGNEVIVFDALTYAGHKENLEPYLSESEQDEREDFIFAQGDICNGGMVTRLIKEYQPDYVINFAAESHVDNSIESPANFIQTNIVGTYNLLEASREYWETLKDEKKEKFRFLQISTDEVYGELGDDGKFTESTAYQPNSPYSASKASADHLVRAWFNTYGLPTIITNCSNNYGPRQFPEKLIPVVITKALSGDPIPVYGTGENIRDWIHVEDHCQGIRRAVLTGTPGQNYLFGGHAEVRNIDLVNNICAILDEIHPRSDNKSYAEQITFVDDRAGHDFRYAIDDSKSEKDLEFLRKYDLSTGLKATVQWYLDNQDWCDAVMKKEKQLS